MRGIPHDPVDGTKYSGLFQGVPVVLEYDSDTGGYKLVVDVEGSLDVNMTGVTVAIGVIDTELPAAMLLNEGALTDPVTAPYIGALGMSNLLGGWLRNKAFQNADIINGPDSIPTLAVGAVLLASNEDELDAVQRLRADDQNRLHTRAFVTGTVDTELPDAAPLADSMANPTAPAVGGFLMGYNEDDDTWERLRANPAISEISPTLASPALITFAIAAGLQQSDNTVQPLPGRAIDGLFVTMISGAFPPGASFDTELPAAVALSDTLANPIAPAVGAYGLSYELSVGEWLRNKAMLNQSANAANDILPTLAVAALLQAYSDNIASDEYVRVHADQQRRLHTRAFVTGTVGTELPAAAALADGMANPTAPAVASHLMGYRGDGTWDRLYMGASGSLAIDLITALEADTDEVTAYVTGTVSLQSGKTILRAVINVSGSGGEKTLVAAAGGSLKIKVLEVMLISDAAVKAFFQSGFTGTALTGPMSLPADGDGFFLNSPANRDLHHFETAANQALVLDMSAAAAIGGWLNYYTEA